MDFLNAGIKLIKPVTILYKNIYMINSNIQKIGLINLLSFVRRNNTSRNRTLGNEYNK